ncbi:zinc finger and BTB domain-containing protein 3-like [Scyliorhinus canicula]|uniref:zinc finger and BTB domain-containing protein 3-like n=1 Tax=Scyliorhinus canicula TaxID=7830 RepID=UPI0018F38D28|nr:zinc finger and BTB domain-containing protein 3-like [Scyliorhinus canicula]
MEFPDHGRVLLQNLRDQRQQGFLCDCTVLVGAVQFQAHRAVLASFSTYFHMFYKEEAVGKRDVVGLDDEIVTAPAFSLLLEFMYEGRLRFSGAPTEDVLAAASFLHMNDIVKVCKSRLKARALAEADSTKKDELLGVSGLSANYKGVVTAQLPPPDPHYASGRLEEVPPPLPLLDHPIADRDLGQWPSDPADTTQPGMETEAYSSKLGNVLASPSSSTESAIRSLEGTAPWQGEQDMSAERGGQRGPARPRLAERHEAEGEDGDLITVKVEDDLFSEDEELPEELPEVCCPPLEDVFQAAPGCCPPLEPPPQAGHIVISDEDEMPSEDDGYPPHGLYCAGLPSSSAEGKPYPDLGGGPNALALSAKLYFQDLPPPPGSEDDLPTCSACGKTFSCTYSLKRHALVHTRERPHSCRFCLRRYSQSGDLYRHMRKYHNAHVSSSSSSSSTAAPSIGVTGQQDSPNGGWKWLDKPPSEQWK